MTSNSSASVLSESNESLSTPKMVAFLLPQVPMIFLYGPIFILPGIYAKYFGLSLTAIASILFITRLFDTVTDPLIGYWSDRHCAGKGSRKPFILVGGVLTVVSSYFLLVPVDPSIFASLDPNQTTAVVNISAGYFLIAISAYYLATTLFRIPYYAWGNELTTTSRERSKLFSSILFITFVGQVLFYALPLLGIFESSEFTPEVLQWAVLLSAITLLPSLFICVKTVPNGRHLIKNSERITVKEVLLILLTNRPLLLLLGSVLFIFIAAGIWLSLLFIFVDSYLLWGQHLSLSYCLSFSIGALSMWAWHRLTVSRGKKNTFIISIILTLFGFLSSAFLAPEESWWYLLCVMTLFYCGMAAINSLELSLLGDVADYGTLKSGHDQMATYFAIHNVVYKIGVAIGSALGLAVSGWYGFDPSQQTHTAEAIQGLYFAFAGLPIPFILVGLMFATLIPLNEHRYSIIRQRLNTRRIRES